MKKIGLYILLITLFIRCAQITPLTGGKRDGDAPKVIKASPANASLNFNSKDITIEFDEYISLRDITNQFIITPQTKELPTIQAKGKALKIKFNENLLPNTTYKLSFGSAIVDLHENNAITNFEYVFSTGTTIDSLNLNGKIIDAVNKKPLTNILVGLYAPQANDSIVYKEKPFYLTRTNNEGAYQFNYLPNSSFKIMAINDINKNVMYDGSDEQIAFHDSLLNPSNTNNVDLILFKELPTKQFIKKTISNEYGKATIIYNKPCNDITTVTWAHNAGSYYINSLNDSITLYYQNEFDTLKAIIHRQSKNDTILITIPSKTDYDKLKKSNRINYKIATNLTALFPYYETPYIRLNFPFALNDIKKEKIEVYKLKDSLKIKLDIEITDNETTANSFKLNTTLETETEYGLNINSGAFTDYTGRTSDSLNFKFKTTSPDDYAQLNLKLLFPKKENYIVLLVNDKEQIIQKRMVSFSLASTNEKILTYEHITPGIYFVHIAEDINKNNAFDTGNYFKHQQPETMYINTTPIKLLAGWEIENEWLVK